MTNLLDSIRAAQQAARDKRRAAPAHIAAMIARAEAGSVPDALAFALEAEETTRRINMFHPALRVLRRVIDRLQALENVYAIEGVQPVVETRAIAFTLGALRAVLATDGPEARHE